jgi:putative ABC transport system substrate-binding protein
MNRREFITLLGSAAAWPLAVHAQQTAKLPIIGILGSGTLADQGQWWAGFVERLGALGWNEGRTIAIQYRWAEGRSERHVEIAAEFALLKVDIIATSGTGAVVAAKQATSDIPIVFAAAGDPVDTGLVASLSKPGNNVTGLSIQQAELAGKRLEILREFIPAVQRLAVLANVSTPGAALDMRKVEATARSLGLDPTVLEIRRAEEIALAIESIKGRAQALYVCTDPRVGAHRLRINTLALGAHLPTIHEERQYVQAAGLLSYGPSFPALWRRAADYVDKILRGAKPADIPVEQSTKFDLVINLTTAKALGLQVPGSLLALADEVIE